jgi:hypothetical protein
MLAQNIIHQKSRWKKSETKLLIFVVEIVKENQTPIGLLVLGYEYKSTTQGCTLHTYSSIVEIIHVDILE